MSTCTDLRNTAESGHTSNTDFHSMVANSRSCHTCTFGNMAFGKQHTAAVGIQQLCCDAA